MIIRNVKSPRFWIISGGILAVGTLFGYLVYSTMIPRADNNYNFLFNSSFDMTKRPPPAQTIDPYQGAYFNGGFYNGANNNPEDEYQDCLNRIEDHRGDPVWQRTREDCERSYFENVQSLKNATPWVSPQNAEAIYAECMRDADQDKPNDEIVTDEYDGQTNRSRAERIAKCQYDKDNITTDPYSNTTTY